MMMCLTVYYLDDVLDSILPCVTSESIIYTKVLGGWDFGTDPKMTLDTRLKVSYIHVCVISVLGPKYHPTSLKYQSF